ncbi:helix-turn-helix domain-containing protein [Chelatococcus sp. GCM10030263]|uniref:AraC family transcriptional regulator n=1 Tax=Chelatococcus sp. GCM10030263 TaxID=3273387 RepID=UPI003609C72A
MTSHQLARGPGWRVYDVVCTAGPQDRPFEECHEGVSIAAVTRGTFQYRSSVGRAVLTPGAVLLGDAGTCFECGHEHGVGDRCLSFQYTPDYLEGVVAALPGVRHSTFGVPRLPPSDRLMPLIAAAEAATGDAAALEEIALTFAGAAVALLAETGPAAAPSRRDERRISDAVRRIEAQIEESLGLADLARSVAMSPYHFLRSFRSVVGMTPRQYLLTLRLERAAVRLRQTAEPIATIAYDSGFGDLSEFNRRFRRVMGVSPRVYRRLGGSKPFACRPI